MKTDCCVARTRSVASMVGALDGGRVGTVPGGTGVSALVIGGIYPGSGSGVQVIVGDGV